MNRLRTGCHPCAWRIERRPRKNVRLVGGEPLIAYSIREAQESAAADRVSTTDDPEIVNVMARSGSSKGAWSSAASRALSRRAINKFRRHVLVYEGTIMTGRKKAYVMPRALLANIDDERDLTLADVVVRRWKALQA